MVEAAGVEPASENVVGKEPTYLVEFKIQSHLVKGALEVSPRALRTDKKRAWLACKSRLEHPDIAPKASPLCDVLQRPVGKATENGYLTN